MKQPLIIIAGATACGKTDTAIELAQKINGEIISADSMQVYKYMDIGTAKPTVEEMKGIKHYLIDTLYPDEEFSIAVFQKMAKKYINEIYEKGKIPILSGGTGFYINSIVYDNNFKETFIDETLRKKLQEDAITKGNLYLHNILREVDFESSEAIHFNNVKRVIRAIEYYKQTGQKISEHNKIEKAKEEIYNSTFIILNRDREIIYDRINQRVDLMIKKGLVDEVSKLLKMGYSKNLVSMQGLGYKEIVSYLDDEISLDYAVEIIKRDTRHFAKRQITWFKHQCNGFWIDMDKNNDIINTIVNCIGDQSDFFLNKYL